MVKTIKKINRLYILNICIGTILTILSIILLAVLRNIFQGLLNIEIQRWLYILLIIGLGISMLSMNLFYLLPQGFNRSKISFLTSIKDINNIFWLSTNIGLILNYFFVNNPITAFTGRLLSDLFDTAMIVCSISIIVYIIKYSAHISEEQVVESNKDYIVSDNPITEPSKDSFNRTIFAEKIANILSGFSGDSLSIGIFGEWGSGKSSFYNLIKEKSKSQQVNYMEFKPWYFSSSEDLIRKFLSSLLLHIKEKENHDPELYLEFKKYISILSSISIRSGGITIASKDIIEKLLFNEETNDLVKVKLRIEELLENSKEKIVVYIDDVDRLDASEIKIIFKLVRVIADFPNIIYIIALDEDIVIESLSDIYGKSDDGLKKASRYIEKFIQVPIYLPKIDTMNLQRYFNQEFNRVFENLKVEKNLNYSLYYDDNVVTNIIKLNMNIRNFKRLLNQISIYFPILENEVNPKDLIYLLIIKINSPELFDFIYWNRELFLNSKLADDEKKIILEKYKQYQDIIIELFPLTSNTFNRKSNDFLEEKKKSIADPSYFNQYFLYAVPNDQWSYKDFQNFIHGLENEDFSKMKHKLNNLVSSFGIEKVIDKILENQHEIHLELKTRIIQIFGDEDFFSRVVPLSSECDYILKMLESFDVCEENISIQSNVQVVLAKIDLIFLNILYEKLGEKSKQFKESVKSEIELRYKNLTFEFLMRNKSNKRAKFIFQKWNNFINDSEIKIKFSNWMKNEQDILDFFGLLVNDSKIEADLIIHSLSFFDENLIEKCLALASEDIDKTNNIFKKELYDKLNNISKDMLDDLERKLSKNIYRHFFILSIERKDEFQIEYIEEYGTATDKKQLESLLLEVKKTKESYENQ